jgi:hypothetical protein
MAETGARATGRPRPWLLALMGVVLGVFLVWEFWPVKPAAPAAVPSKSRTPARSANTPVEATDPADLNVRLDELAKARPKTGEERRNPFQFQPKAPPPPPPESRVSQRAGQTAPAVPQGPPQPPPPPPIPLKFIGVVEPKPGDRIAAFSDCRYTFRGREGDIVDGRFRLVKIGVESVTMEYLDGRGRTAIRLTGLDCVGK